VTDAIALGQRHRGRRPKANKRVPLSLLLDPKLRSLIVEMAAENDCSVTGQVERLLEQSIKKRFRPEELIPFPRGRVQVQLVNNTSYPININIIGVSVTGSRAGIFLEINYPGPSKDERIARDLGISRGMAKMLRRGRAWTVARLDQAMELWPRFREFVFPPPPGEPIEQLAAGFARLVDEVAELRQELRAERPLRDSLRDEPAKERAE
jgi:hypothetical protein